MLNTMVYWKLILINNIVWVYLIRKNTYMNNTFEYYLVIVILLLFCLLSFNVQPVINALSII